MCRIFDKQRCFIFTAKECLQNPSPASFFAGKVYKSYRRSFGDDLEASTALGLVLAVGALWFTQDFPENKSACQTNLRRDSRQNTAFTTM
jgi:hypothetical protein